MRCFADAPAGAGDFALGLMAEVDLVWDDDASDYGVEVLHTAEVGHAVPGIAELAAFAEYIGIARDDGATYRTLVRAGLAWTLTDDWVLDCGTTVGLADDAEDLSSFVGTSFRY